MPRVHRGSRPHHPGRVRQALNAGPVRNRMEQRPIIGTGLRNLRARAGPPLRVALVVLVFAFVADTGTTLLAGGDARGDDLNPFLPELSDAQYLAFVGVRLLGAVALLLWFWPASLKTRWRSRAFRLLLPFSYADRRSYFGAFLILCVPGLKLVAAASNALLAAHGEPPCSPFTAIVAGMALGVLLGNSLLEWRFHELGGRSRRH